MAKRRRVSAYNLGFAHGARRTKARAIRYVSSRTRRNFRRLPVSSVGWALTRGMRADVKVSKLRARRGGVRRKAYTKAGVQALRKRVRFTVKNRW